MKYTRQTIKNSITHQKYDNIQTTYLLLNRKTSDINQTKHPKKYILKYKIKIF